MSSLNKAMIIGRLGADPEVRYTQSNTAVATLNVATNERFKDRNGELQERTEWHRVVAWGRLAEICQEYLKKGDRKSTRLNSSHVAISYAVFCLKKKKENYI